MAEDVSDAETFHAEYSLSNQLVSGSANYVYRPAAHGGALTFNLKGLDAGGNVLASGSGSVELVPGETVTLTVWLAPCGEAGGCEIADMAMPPDLSLGVTVQQFCDDTCSLMKSKCGIPYILNKCSSACQLAPVFRECAMQVGGDCKALALCSFKQFQAAFCPGGGYPMGTATCTETANCEGACNVNAPGAPCLCSCFAKLDPAKALLSTANTVCAQTNCASECSGPTFNGAACNRCGYMHCGTDACFSN